MRLRRQRFLARIAETHSCFNCAVCANLELHATCRWRRLPLPLHDSLVAFASLHEYAVHYQQKCSETVEAVSETTVSSSASYLTPPPLQPPPSPASAPPPALQPPFSASQPAGISTHTLPCYIMTIELRFTYSAVAVTVAVTVTAVAVHSPLH